MSGPCVGMCEVVEERSLVAEVQMQSGREPQDRSEALADLVEGTLVRGFPGLFFPPALERAFVLRTEAARRRLITEAGLAAVLLYAGMVLADVLLTPGTVGLALMLRLGVFAPLILLGLAFIHWSRMPAFSEWLIALAGMLAVTLTATILLNSQERWALARVVEINIIVVFTCTLARFWPAAVLGAYTLLVHLALVHQLPDFTGVLVINTTLLAAVILGFTLYGNYTLERDERMAFLLEERERALQAALEESHAQLARMVTTDALTDVANRRHAESYLAQSWAHALQRQQCMAIIMIDIDHFKRYNDRFGHQAGDRCLQAVARALAQCSRRAGDLVARVGGEEFMVVMADVDQPTAQRVAQRIQDAVQSLGLPHPASACAPVVTVSVGVAAAKARADLQPHHLVQHADSALYAAKARGRNQVCVRQADGQVHCIGGPQSGADEGTA